MLGLSAKATYSTEDEEKRGVGQRWTASCSSGSGLDKTTDTTLYRWQDVVVVAWMEISDFAFDFYFQCSFPSPVFLFLPAVLFFF